MDAITTPDMSAAEIEMRREAYGLNDPVYVQYFRWLNNILHGNFGYSLLSHTSIKYDLMIRIPNTAILVLASYATAYVLAIVLGLVAGSYKTAGRIKSSMDFARSELPRLRSGSPCF